MQNRTQYWMTHLAAAKFEGLTIPAYADKHGVGASTLYRWKQRLESANNQTGYETPHPAGNITTATVAAAKSPVSATPTTGKFIALRVTADTNASAITPLTHPNQATIAEQNTTCTLSLPGGIGLHLRTLPDVTWLLSLSRAAQEAN